MQDIVLCSEEGLAVRVGGGPVMSLPWSEVTRVHAYRLDAVQSQPLIVGVEDETGHVVELNPGMEGWAEFISRIAALSGSTAPDLTRRLEALAPHDAIVSLYP